MPKFNPAIVLYARDIAATRAFYECLGLKFIEDHHGNGPIHFIHDFRGIVLEIYPLKAGIETVPCDSFSFVFFVDRLDESLALLELASARPESVDARSAAIRDPEGRLVRLIEAPAESSDNPS